MILLYFYTNRALRVRADVETCGGSVSYDNSFKIPTFSGTLLQDPSDVVLINGLSFKRYIQPLEEFGILGAAQNIASGQPALSRALSWRSDISTKSKSTATAPVRRKRVQPEKINYESVKKVISNHFKSGLVDSWSMQKWWSHLRVQFGIKESNTKAMMKVVQLVSAEIDNSNNRLSANVDDRNLQSPSLEFLKKKRRLLTDDVKSNYDGCSDSWGHDEEHSEDDSKGSSNNSFLHDNENNGPISGSYDDSSTVDHTVNELPQHDLFSWTGSLQEESKNAV